MDKRSINRIAIINILSTVLIQGITFLAAPIFSRLMGTTNYGLYSTYTTWVTLAVAIFGLQTSSTLAVARKRFPEEDQNKYQSSVLFLGLISFAAFSLIVLLFLPQISNVLKMEELVCAFVLINGLGRVCVDFANAKYSVEFEAEKNFKLSMAFTLGGMLVSLLLFKVVTEAVNYYARILGVSLVTLLLGVVLSISILGKGKRLIDRSYWRFCLPLAIPVVFHAVSGTILNQSDRLMLKFLLTDAEVGIYSLACSFGAIMSIIYLALNNSWVPFYYEFSRNKQIDTMKQHARNYMELFTVLCVGFLLLSPEVFRIFAGKEYWSGAAFIPLFVVAHYFTFLYSFAVNYETFHENTRIMAITTVIAALINIALNYFLIVSMGAIGAVLATLIAHVIQFALHYFSAKYIIKGSEYPFPFKFYAPFAIILVGVGILCYCVDARMAICRWLAGAALGVWEFLRVYKRKSIF